MPHLIDQMQDLISTAGGIRQFDGRFDLFGDEDDNFGDKMVAFKTQSLLQAAPGSSMALNAPSIFSEMDRSSTGSSSMMSPTHTGQGDNFCDKMVAFKVRRRPSLARNSQQDSISTTGGVGEFDGSQCPFDLFGDGS
ncbi:hypothetical protein MJO29_014962 [Puccinia striiformis f. sp. tritici]|nr:hypothetical protein MJO29_014962 [Puccinia striiformis f. sp. tritici]